MVSSHHYIIYRMVKEEILQKTEEYAKQCSKDNEPGHDFSHIQRVRKLAIYLAEEYQLDTFYVEILALLHDVEDHKLNNGHNVSEFLNTLDLLDSVKDKLVYILSHLSFSKYPTLPEHFPLIGKIVSDADRLDVIGAIGIARAFSYGGSHHRSFEDTLKHFDEKLLVLDQYLYLDKSKEIATKRMEILRQFYDDFIKEKDFQN